MEILVLDPAEHQMHAMAVGYLEATIRQEEMVIILMEIPDHLGLAETLDPLLEVLEILEMIWI